MKYSARLDRIFLTALSVFFVLTLCACHNNNSADDNSGADKMTAATGDQKPAGTGTTTQVYPVVTVEQRALDTDLSLPGNLEAYQDVPLHAKVEGYVSSIGVDRGSIVKKGQHLMTITAPEVDAKVKEAYSKVSAADASYKQAIAAERSMISKKVEAKAKLDSDQLTYTRLQQARKNFSGAVAENDIDMAEKTVEADNASVTSLDAEIQAAKNLVVSEKNNEEAMEGLYDSVKAMKSYLSIDAPFDGVITERNVHEGSIVAIEANRTGVPMLRIQEVDLLRLVVAVPESAVSGVHIGQKIEFTVPAFLGKTFTGVVARPGYALDNSTRTMPVELNVWNQDRELEPGMFASVKWKVTRPYETLFLPRSAVSTDLKNSFVMRVRDGIAERVSVQQGQTMGNQVEVIGDLKSGDEVMLKPSDEIKNGTRLVTRLADAHQIESASRHTTAGGE